MYVSGTNGCNIPCVFALLPNKTRTAYDQFFTNDQWPICNNIQITDAPLAALFDFELTAISAAKCSSLDADFIECLFLIYHLTLRIINIQCLQDGHRSSVCLWLCMTPALIFVPAVEKMDLHKSLCEELRWHFAAQAWFRCSEKTVEFKN